MNTSADHQAGGRWRFGPGLLVTAAFIGPGTVTTASQAGARFGFALLWTLILATLATIVLQEMAARLGLVTRRGLAEAIRQSIGSVWLRRLSLGLILTAIVLGNTAYQTGNLMGAGIGIHALTGASVEAGAGIVGLVLAAVLAIGSSTRKLRTMLVAIVLAMSLAFLATAVATRPSFGEILRGTTFWSLPAGAGWTALALFGTTVVPYNLFLHAAAVQRHWPLDGNLGQQLRDARIDTVVAIALGGVVTAAIVATSAAAFQGNGEAPANIGEFASQLVPVLGTAGKTLFAIGLAAAGLTSAVTAPLAAGCTVAGVWPGASQRATTVTAVAVALVGAGLAFAFGKSPQATIVAAQAANGLLLPFVAVFLLGVMNRRKLLGEYRNGKLLNLAGGLVVLAACGLSLKSLLPLVW